MMVLLLGGGTYPLTLPCFKDILFLLVIAFDYVTEPEPPRGVPSRCGCRQHQSRCRTTAREPAGGVETGDGAGTRGRRDPVGAAAEGRRPHAPGRGAGRLCPADLRPRGAGGGGGRR